jgi:hypothetical protein
VSLCLSTHLHGSELPDRKMPSSKTDALLPVEDRTRRSDSRHQHEQNHQRQPKRQRKQNARDIESEFPANFRNASVCGADHGWRPCNPSTRGDVAQNSRVRAMILSNQTIIRRSDCVSSPNKSDSRAASDLPQGPVPSGRSLFITRCNRVRSSTLRTEVFPLRLFLGGDAQPHDEDRPVKRSWPATTLSLPHSH